MIRNVKVLGIAVVAVFAMSAMVASAAQANNYWLTSDAAAGVTTFLTGEQKTRTGGLVDEFSTTAGVVKCTGAKYAGSGVGPTISTAGVHPEFSGCTAFGFSAEVITSNCNYVFHVETETAGGIYHTTATIECSGANEITVIAKVGGVTKCTLHIEPQDAGTVTFTKGTKTNGIKDIHTDINLAGLRYTETKGEGAGACVTSTTQSNGTYVGTATITGFSDAAHTKETNIDLG